MPDIFGTGDIGATGWPGYFETSLNIAADQVPNAANTVDTVPMNAVQAMAPVSNNGVQNWSGFWQDITKGVIGYAVKKDAALSGLQPAAGTTVVRASTAGQARTPPGLLMVLAIGAIGVLALRGR